MARNKSKAAPGGKGGASKNEHLVPEEDEDIYRNATVARLRAQCAEEGLGTNGLKYDLYRRLVDNGTRLYNQASDTEGEESSSSSSDSSSDLGDDGNGGPSGGRPAPGSARLGRKRRRDSSSSSDGGSDRPDPGTPPRRRRRLIALPPELQILVIEALHPATLWSLIDSAPDEFLDAEQPGGINALILEARNYHRYDYPPPSRPPSPPPASPAAEAGDQGGGESDNPDDNPHDDDNDDGDNSDDSDDDGNVDDDGDDDEPPRPMSLLEWVASRATYEAGFRRVYRRRILQVLDAYLQVYGAEPNTPIGMLPNENPRDFILNYFRGNRTHLPLTQAVYDDQDAIAAMAVTLMIMRGANVNRADISGSYMPLDYAIMGLGSDPEVRIAHSVQIVFSLLGAGADPGLLPADNFTAREARRMLKDITDIDDDDELDALRINNPLGLSARDFIADERMAYQDRVLLALVVISRQDMDYPHFV
jgi:hypothetical protein